MQMSANWWFPKLKQTGADLKVHPYYKCKDKPADLQKLGQEKAL